MLPNEIDQLAHIAEAKSGGGIGSTVVYGESSCPRVTQCCTGKNNIGYITNTFVQLPRIQDVGFSSMAHLPRFIQVEKRSACVINISVAGGNHAVIDDQPPLTSLDGRGSGSDLSALPTQSFSAHHPAMPSPVTEVRALTVKDVSKGSMTGITGPREHRVFSLDSAGEQNAVAIVGQERIVELMEGFEIVCIGHSNRRTVIAIAPRHIKAVLQPTDAWIIAILEASSIRILCDKGNGLGLNAPLPSIITAPCMQTHMSASIVATKDAGKAVMERYYGTIKDAIGAWNEIPGDYGVVGAAPQNLAAARRSILPRDITNWRTSYSEITVCTHEINLLAQEFSQGRFHSLGPDAISLLGKVQAVGHHIF